MLKLEGNFENIYQIQNVHFVGEQEIFHGHTANY